MKKTLAKILAIVMVFTLLSANYPAVHAQPQGLTPVRAVFEYMGAIVTWQAETATIHISWARSIAIVHTRQPVVYVEGVRFLLQDGVLLDGGFSFLSITDFEILLNAMMKALLAEGIRQQLPISDSALPEAIRHIVSENRESEFPPVAANLESILAAFHTPGLTAAKDAEIAARITAIIQNPPHVAEMSHETLLAELDNLFGLLTTIGLQFVESIEVYEQVKVQILASISASPNPIETDAFVNTILLPYLTSVLGSDIASMVISDAWLPVPMSTEFSHEAFVDEIYFIFDVLQYGYGAYQLKGGASVFDPLRDSMLETLATMRNPLSVGEYISQVLLPYLSSVIKDNHVNLFAHNLGVRSQLYMNEEMFLSRLDDMYILEMNEETYRVVGVTRDGNEIELMPTLTPNGELAWSFGYLSLAGMVGETVEVVASLENIETGKVMDQAVVLEFIPNSTLHDQEIFSLTNMNGVPVLRNGRLFNPVTLTLQDFADTGADLHDEPVLILDIRGHDGGSDIFAFDWIRQFTGHAPSYSMNFSSVRLSSLTVNAAVSHMPASVPPRWESTIGYPEPVFIPNDTLVIVIVDGGAGSAGDSFTGFMRQMENVIIVGTNTSGTLVTGNVGRVVLPTSGISFGFGTSLNIRPNLSQFEGVGFMPDLWVSPNESLDRVLAFIEQMR